MVDVSPLAGLVPKSSLFEVLAVEEDVSLQVCLQVQQVALMGNLTIEVVVENVKDAAHPEGVTGVDELVCPPVIPPKLCLPLR